MADLYSKVTLRPRSKLEKLVEMLEPACEIPQRPKNGLVAQLALYYLLWGECGAPAAAEAVKALMEAGSVDAAKLAAGPREVVDRLCSPARAAEVLAALQAVGRLAADGLEASARRDVEEGRRRLATLPRLGPDQIDFLLLASGIASVVAPPLAALRVVARVGYPGTCYATLARTLDAELPEGDPQEVAWRAHHVLKQHGNKTCREKPDCPSCKAEPACAYAGRGEDPAGAITAPSAAPVRSGEGPGG